MSARLPFSPETELPCWRSWC